MNKNRLRLRYYTQLIRSSYRPQSFVKNKEDFAVHVLKRASKLNRKVMERIQYNHIKIIDHSQIFVETAILILHMNRRNLKITMGDIGSCKVALGMMPVCKPMLEKMNNALYPTLEDFQAKFYALYLEREMEYDSLNAVVSDNLQNDSVLLRYLNHLIKHLSPVNLTPNILADIKSSIVVFLITYEKAIRNELDKGFYLFVYKYLLFQQKLVIKK